MREKHSIHVISTGVQINLTITKGLLQILFKIPVVDTQAEEVI